MLNLRLLCSCYLFALEDGFQLDVKLQTMILTHNKDSYIILKLQKNSYIEYTHAIRYPTAWHLTKCHLTPRCSLLRRAIFALKILQQLHGFSSHDDLLQHRFQKRDHSVLPAWRGLVTARTGTGIITHLLFILCLFWHTI